jgi:hypothetical protein
LKSVSASKSLHYLNQLKPPFVHFESLFCGIASHSEMAMELYHYVNGTKTDGLNPKMSGDCSGLRGDCTGLRGKPWFPYRLRSGKPELRFGMLIFVAQNYLFVRSMLA